MQEKGVDAKFPHVVQQEYTFEPLPDGKYIARFVRAVAQDGEFILGIYQVSFGKYRGKLLQLMFDNAAAKKLTWECTGMYLERLAFEGVALADAWYNAQNNSDGEYIVNVKNHRIRSIPEPDGEKMERLIKKLSKT